MMQPAALQDYLYQHIPLSRAMEVRVEAVSETQLSLSAPLAPNINHRETVFGGSASTLAILAAWSLLHTRLRREGIRSRLVIQRNAMTYERPMAGRFSATAVWGEDQNWDRTIRMLRRRGKARCTVSATVACSGEVAGRFEGDFVALGI